MSDPIAFADLRLGDVVRRTETFPDGTIITTTGTIADFPLFDVPLDVDPTEEGIESHLGATSRDGIILAESERLSAFTKDPAAVLVERITESVRTQERDA